MSPVPSTLPRVATFRACEQWTPADGGTSIRLDGPSLDTQIDQWIERTHAYVISAGPIGITELKNDGITVRVTLSIAVTYLPATDGFYDEQNNEAGNRNQPLDTTAQRVTAASQVVAAADSSNRADPRNARRDLFGLPRID